MKSLETPSVYHIIHDELYELDEESFEFLVKCSSGAGCDSEKSEFTGYCLDEGILTLERPSVIRPLLKKSPAPSLRYLELQITDRCNLRCRHCYIGECGGNDLPVGDIGNVLKQFEEMQGLRVLLTGGEPFMHRNFSEVNEMLPDFRLRKVLFTNGLLLDGKRLGSLNVDEVQISIDGLEGGHDSLRGKGSFRSAMHAVKICKDAGMPVSVSTMAHSGNLEDFDEMDRLFREMGIKDWTVDIPCETGRLKENPGFSISPEEGGRYLRYGYGEGLHSSSGGYGCGLHLMSVSADGRTSKCTFYADSAPAGRINDGLLKCWKKIVPVRLDRLECDCEYLESCRGGCRYRAEVLGNPDGKDLYRCFSYDIIGTNTQGKKP
ncbi:MAG: radical SAM protein [Nitrospirae bacterium]|nr:radical SAM protein [Nitrospirota bacterium]